MRCMLVELFKLTVCATVAFPNSGQQRLHDCNCRSMLDGNNSPEARSMLIELILSIPARLSDLLVVLTSLMRPLVMALQEGQELVGQGLRTLEYWVDRY